MASSKSLFWSFANVLTKARYDALLAVYGSLERASRFLDGALLRRLGCREETAHAVLRRLEAFDERIYGEKLKEKGILFFDWTDGAFPSRLREIGDPPPFLYARGDPAILAQPCIGVVGTRAMTDYGKRAVETFTQSFVGAGVVTVSGLAKGIDAACARMAVHCGGKTVAVLGHGLGMIYPRKHQKLAEDIVESGGLLVSEFPLDIVPERFTFPSRNRIIAGLSMGTLVVEAPEGSGAMITATLAAEYGRDVFAVPGPIFDANFVGCHALIAKGARIASHPREVLEELGIVVPDQPQEYQFSPSTPDESSMWNALTTMPQHVDALVDLVGLPAAQVSMILTLFELQGVARNLGAGQWVRC